MRKFILTISEGIQVVIEAETLEEAKKQYEFIKQESRNSKLEFSKVSKQTTNPIRRGLYEHLFELREEGFFANPQTLGDIKSKLQEKTLHYPTTTFPSYLNRLIREKILRRLKQTKYGKEAWVYVNY